MAHKLDRFKDQISLFRDSGESVRSIAAKLSESTGEKIAASTVHHFISRQGNGNGESKESPQVSEAIPARDMDSIQVRLNELKAQLDRIERVISFVNIGLPSGALVTVYYADLKKLNYQDYEKYGNVRVRAKHLLRRIAMWTLERLERRYEQFRTRSSESIR